MAVRKRKMIGKDVWQADIFDATGSRIRRSFATKQEAREWEAEQTLEAGKPQPVPSTHRDITLLEWWEIWEPQQTGIEAATRQSYGHLFTRHIAPTLGHLRIRDVHRGHVRALLNTKRLTLAPNSVRLIRATLSVLLGDAVSDGIIQENPARVLAQERRKRPDRVSKADRVKHIKPLSRDTLAAFLDAVSRWCSPRDATLFLVLADAGLRPSEALALKWEDIDPVSRTFHVERALSRLGTLKDTKTSTARDVDMTRRLVDTLSRLQASREADALLAATTPSSYLFTTDTGSFLSLRNVARKFHTILLRAQLPRHRLYDLRHTFATHLLEANAPIPYVAAQMGHAKPVTTMQWYAA